MQWKTRKILIDLETGEIIREEDEYKYIVIKKIKKITANATTQRGVIEYTIECRRSERIQGRLF